MLAYCAAAGAMDCYEALNEQQVDLAQQLKNLVAPLVQVGGKRTWLDTPQRDSRQPSRRKGNQSLHVPCAYHQSWFAIRLQQAAHLERVIRVSRSPWRDELDAGSNAVLQADQHACTSYGSVATQQHVQQ